MKNHVHSKTEESRTHASPALKILRFRKSERLVHWALAIPFLVCYSTALVLVVIYNPEPTRPYRDVFSLIHRTSGVSLAILPLLAIIRCSGDWRIHFYNIRQAWAWSMKDFKWLVFMGLATISNRFELPEQGKFNAAEKINFMTLMATYPLYIITGVMIWITHGVLLAWIVHFFMALVATPLVFGHIFMATANPDTRAGLSGMFSGFVDRRWAKHHYGDWFREHFEHGEPTSDSRSRIKILDTVGSTEDDPPLGMPGLDSLAQALHSSAPELATRCTIESAFLPGCSPGVRESDRWIATALAVAKEIQDGAGGVVVVHDLQSAHYTAAALSFMIRQPPVPVVVAGSGNGRRANDADVVRDMVCATHAAASDIAEVMSTYPSRSGEGCISLLRATRPYPANADVSPADWKGEDTPLARVHPGGIEYLRNDYKARRDDGIVTVNAFFDDRLALVHCHPNMKRDVISALATNGYHGAILTSAETIGDQILPVLASARAAGVLLYAAGSFNSHGGTMPNLGSIAKLKDSGVVCIPEMTPDVAYVKLGWALGCTTDPIVAEQIMLTPFAAEITGGAHLGRSSSMLGEAGLPQPCTPV